MQIVINLVPGVERLHFRRFAIELCCQLLNLVGVVEGIFSTEFRRCQREPFNALLEVPGYDERRLERSVLQIYLKKRTVRCHGD